MSQFKLTASKLAQTLDCPGWIGLCNSNNVQPTTNEWAEMGTKLHKAIYDCNIFDALDEDDQKLILLCRSFLEKQEPKGCDVKLEAKMGGEE